MNRKDAATLLEVNRLYGGYGKVPVLADVSFKVCDGEIVGMLGHNGSGKTTLLKHLMGYLPADGGSITFDGQDITKLSVHRRSLLGLGYVPQGREIFPQLTVEENLRFAWDGATGSEENALERTLQDFPQLRKLLGRKGDFLSGGEKQLLAIARCLLSDPIMVLLDEPTEGVQPSIIDEVAETLSRIRNERGLSILLVEQNFDFLARLSDHLLVIERGEIIGQANSSELSSSDFLAKFTGLGLVRSGRTDSTAAAQNPQPTRNTDPLHSLDKLERRRIENEQPEQLRATTRNKLRTSMKLKRPDLQQMRDMSQSMHMSMSDSELSDYLRVMEPYLQAYDQLNTSPDYLAAVKYPRTFGVRPEPEDNLLNAWYVKTEVRGAAGGRLADKRIALKDTVSLAGVPMMNGASVLEGYVPDMDATIVTRMLDEGATIVGKATCEYLCLSGGSHTSATGPVLNPWKTTHMAGGSSSGSGALVAAGEVDMAIGGDQGGSIRIPSSNCGCYGMKPTHGLVPYTGVFPIEQTIDHVGPITSTVSDNALLLEILAGTDGLDPRQYKPRTDDYRSALGRGVHKMRIGMLAEGFNRPETEEDVDAAVREASNVFRQLGAVIEELSIPAHLQAPICWTAIAVEGMQDLMMHGNSSGTNYRGLYQPGLVEFFSGWRNHADELSNTLKVCMFLGEYFQEYYHGKYYGKAQNIARKLKVEFDRVFKEFDLLILPTLPMKAQPIPTSETSFDLCIQRAFEMIGNTCTFNVFGYPAMSIPCGFREGLPIGMMIVGDFYQEATIYRAAFAFEQAVDWKTL